MRRAASVRMRAAGAFIAWDRAARHRGSAPFTEPPTIAYVIYPDRLAHVCAEILPDGRIRAACGACFADDDRTMAPAEYAPCRACAREAP